MSSPSPPRRPPDHPRPTPSPLPPMGTALIHSPPLSTLNTAHITHRTIPRRPHRPGFAAARLAGAQFRVSWRTNCVEVRHRDTVDVRDSKYPDPMVSFSPAAWRAFLDIINSENS